MAAVNLKIYFLYLTVFVTGAAVLIIEIVGTRVMAPFYGSTIYVWSSLISVTLAALALGYWLGGKIIDKKPDYKILYGAIALTGLSLFSLSFLDTFILTRTNVFGIRFGPLAATSALFFLPLFLLGTVSPIAVKMRANSLDRLGVTAGGLYAVATLGSLFGGLVSGFLLAPNYSAKAILSSLSVLLAALGAAGSLLFSPIAAPYIIGVNVAVALLVFLYSIQTFNSSAVRSKIAIKPEIKESASQTAVIIGSKKNIASKELALEEEMPRFPTLFTTKGAVEANVVYHEPSLYGDIVVFDYTGIRRCFLIDGTNETCWNFESGRPSTYVWNTKLLLEKLTPERNIQDILVVGVGAGTLLKTLDGGEYSIDGVDINPKMLEVAKTYFLEPKDLSYRIFIDDGRHFLNVNSKKYDAIVLDICYVNEHNVHLWTKEFYALVKNSLKDPENGLVIASYGVVAKNPLSERLDHMIANAMRESFAHVYTAMREEIQPEEFDMAIFLATNQPVEKPIEQPVLSDWVFNASILPTSDEKAGEMLKLFLPATEKIREQAISNFGEKLLLPI